MHQERVRHARKAGHRQMLTVLEIQDVKLGAARKPAAKKAAEPAEEAASE